MRRWIPFVALTLLLAACGGGSGDSPFDTGSRSDSTAAGSDDSDGGVDSEGTGSETTSDGTQIFVATGLGIDVVDLLAETQGAFVDGYDSPYGLTVAQGDLWFSEAPGSLVSVDAASGDENGTAALPGQFAGLSVTDDTAWVIAGLIGADSQLVAIERDGMTVRGSAVPPAPTYYTLVAASGNDVWVSGGDLESSTTVRRVDPTAVTVGEPVDSGVIAHSMLVGLGALWIGGIRPATPDGLTSPVAAIAKLDASTGVVLDLFEIGGIRDDAVVLESAFGSLWATQGLEAVLIKFDPATGEELGRVDVGSGAAGIPYPILVTNDAVWVVNSTDSQALSFDPDTLEFQSGIDLPFFAGAFAFVP